MDINSNIKCNSNVKIQNSTTDLLNTYKSRVAEAYKKCHIFSVYRTRRHAGKLLRCRGWLEKIHSSNIMENLQNLPIETLLQHAEPGNNYETMAISKIIHHLPAFFIWIPKERHFNIVEMAYRDRIICGSQLNFTTKIGLTRCVEQMHWCKDQIVSETFHPRFYRMGPQFMERKEFIADFRCTQCRCLLKFIIENIDKPHEIIDCFNGTVLREVITFALNNLKLQLLDFEHSYLDEGHEVLNLKKWTSFIKDSSLVLQKKSKIKASLEEMTEIAQNASEFLIKLEKIYPDYKLDGCRNIWILKPYFQNRGKGIEVKGDLEVILQLIQKSKRRYIVQKYVERPFLIYNRKFDIRQYMLLTISETMLRIYLYKDCYFKFSTQEYTLDDLRRRAHVTNYTVQRKYSYDLEDSRLPTNYMWSLEQFLQYLKYVDAPANIWEEKIFPVFGQNVIEVIESSVQQMNLIKNSFELFGCDFMLDEHYNPVLLEINRSPDLSASTTVTERLCRMVQEDVVKVVVDLPKDKTASIGNFHLVYGLKYKCKKDFIPNLKISVHGNAVLRKSQVNTTM